ncbi:hypothetical protein CALVIDRAFT_552025 [Calocera viscosa TUFC12733]|uniref:Aip3p/Bud6 N-terminal domain-containing protein n=1 Tax=Calocera viscosa (strain TUFC12733) TaxID=1330018 RepID=A0A167S8U1_CALVF|nr:hypothetical protein CALVIDRAFT_552025 [Calocera viscosa TUFC12733]
MLSRSVSSYTTRGSTANVAGFEGRDRRFKPRASLPLPVPQELPSPAVVDEHATRMIASGEQVMQALELWSLNKKAVWQVSATFARFSNECSTSTSLFVAAGADVSTLKTVPPELRRTLEQLMSQDASVRRFKEFKPALDDIVQRFIGELRKIQEVHGVASELAKPSPIPESRSINASLKAFVRSVGQIKEAIDVWSVKETPDDEIRTSLRQLEGDFEELSSSFSDRGVDLTGDISPVFEELKSLVNELISPDVSSEWEDPFDDQLNSLLIRLLSGLKAKQSVHRVGAGRLAPVRPAFKFLRTVRKLDPQVRTLLHTNVPTSDQMAPPKPKAGKSSSSKKGPKEKVFHPESRKAGQLERKLLRKHKLEKAGVAKNHKALEQEALALTLSEVHGILRDVWLTRFDHLIEAEQAARRKGRPRSTKEDKLLEQKMKDTEDYRTGLEIPDLTHPATVALFRKWNADDPGFLPLLRWIRVSSESPQEAIVSKAGNQKALLNAAADAGLSLDLSQHAVDPEIEMSELALGPVPVPSHIVEESLAAELDSLL